MNKQLAKLLGIHLGDGCISITNKYHEYAISGDIREEKAYYDTTVTPLYNKLIFQPILKKKISPKSYIKNGTYGVIVFKKEVVDYFLDLGISPGSKLNAKIPDQIIDNKECWPHFLRGLFDTDGSIYFNKNYSVKKDRRMHNRPRIKLGMTSKNIIDQVESMLNNMDYNVYRKPPYKGKRDKNPVHSVMIQRVNDINKFIAQIGFDNLKHKTKWILYKKIGYCPPYTSIDQRINLIAQAKSL